MLPLGRHGYWGSPDTPCSTQMEMIFPLTPNREKLFGCMREEVTKPSRHGPLVGQPYRPLRGECLSFLDKDLACFSVTNFVHKLWLWLPLCPDIRRCHIERYHSGRNIQHSGERACIQPAHEVLSYQSLSVQGAV